LNPLLQILGANPVIKSSETPKTADSFSGIGSNTETSEIAGNGEPVGQFKNILGDYNVKQVLINGATGNKVLSDIELRYLIANSANGPVLLNNTDAMSDSNSTEQSTVSNLIVGETILSSSGQINRDDKIQSLLSENKMNTTQLIQTDQTAKPTGSVVINAPIDTEKTETTDILFRTNIQNLSKTDNSLNNDIFSQKQNVLNLRQVDLMERSTTVAVQSELNQTAVDEKTSVKSMLDIPSIARIIPAEAAVNGDGKTNLLSNMPAAGSQNSESSIGSFNGSTTGIGANNSGNDTNSSTLMNNPDSQTGLGDKSTKLNIGNFARTLGGEMLTSATQDTGSTTRTSAKTDTAGVRFIMPDNMSENGTNVNRTITIKMEPENLGTIRLTLSSANHGLTGRMVVDSAVTHAIVESHIDHLFSELSDKGIKLDAFSLSVGVDAGADKSTQERKPFRMNNRGGVNKDNNRLESNKPTVAQLAADRMYINSGGVNWLA